MFLNSLLVICLWGSVDDAATTSRRNSSDVVAVPTPGISSSRSSTPGTPGIGADQSQGSGYVKQPVVELPAYFWEHLQHLSILEILYKTGENSTHSDVCGLLAHALEQLKNPSENEEYDTLYNAVVSELKRRAAVKDNNTPKVVAFTRIYDQEDETVEDFINQCSAAMFKSTPIAFNENKAVQLIAPQTYLCLKAQHTRRFGDQNEASDLFIEYGNKSRELQKWAKEFITNFEDSNSQK